MSWLDGHVGELGQVAARAGLIYATALLGLRFAQRRTLAQWTAIDFAAAVAIGSIMGRTALAHDQSVLMGVVALATIVAAHWVMSTARFSSGFAKLVDHRVRLLVVDGRLRRDQMRICGLTENDVLAQLREKGYFTLEGLRYVLYETKGGLTVVPETAGGRAELIEVGLRDATGHDEPTVLR
ncbi:MAG TPA: YetF domain-containing protein [Acidimicrobiales bacterium]|nr:YetF domain-containing protein [Acidimicrobiales bacterium]